MKKEKQLRLDLAQERLEKLVAQGLMPCVADDFAKDGTIYYSERTPLGGVLNYANELGSCPAFVVAKIKELEEKYNSTVYHITHEVANFGECWDLWCITDEDVDYKNDLESSFENEHITFSYVINASVPEFSEFGSIQFALKAGGAVRIS